MNSTVAQHSIFCFPHLWRNIAQELLSGWYSPIESVYQVLGCPTDCIIRCVREDVPHVAVVRGSVSDKKILVTHQKENVWNQRVISYLYISLKWCIYFLQRATIESTWLTILRPSINELSKNCNINRKHQVFVYLSTTIFVIICATCHHKHHPHVYSVCCLCPLSCNPARVHKLSPFLAAYVDLGAILIC